MTDLFALSIVLDVLGYPALVFAALALVWLAVPVRPVVVRTPSPRGWKQAMAFAGLLVPGLWDLLFGRAIWGALVLWSFLMSIGIVLTLRNGGPFTRLVGWGMTFFDEVPVSPYPELAWVGYLTAALSVTLFVASGFRTARGVLAERRSSALGLRS